MEEGWAAGYIGAGRVDCESERVKKRWLTSLTPHHPHDDTGRHNEWLRTIFIGTACTQVITGDSVEVDPVGRPPGRDDLGRPPWSRLPVLRS